MTKIKFVLFIIFGFLILLSACQSVSKKIDEKTIQEEKLLNFIAYSSRNVEFYSYNQSK